jgi:hypothetical protein
MIDPDQSTSTVRENVAIGMLQSETPRMPSTHASAVNAVNAAAYGLWPATRQQGRVTA